MLICVLVHVKGRDVEDGLRKEITQGTHGPEAMESQIVVEREPVGSSGSKPSLVKKGSATRFVVSESLLWLATIAVGLHIAIESLAVRN